MDQAPLSDSLKFASIDIGSNAMRLLFCRVIKNSSTTFIKESLIRMPLRLGEDAFTIGKISKENEDRLKDTIHAFHLMIKAYEPISFKACATAALRTASNGKEIVDRINRLYDVGLEIISGKEEAQIKTDPLTELLGRPPVRLSGNFVPVEPEIKDNPEVERPFPSRLLRKN